MKHWLEILNNTKVDLSKYNDDELNDIEKIQLKHNLKKRINSKKRSNSKKTIVASVAILCMLFITKSNIIADKLEIFMSSDDNVSKNPINNFENYSNSNAYNYKNFVEQSVTNSGLTITINEVIFDYKNIIITYTLSSNEFDTESIDIIPKVYINGDEVKRAGISGTYSDKDKNLKQFIIEPKKPINNIGDFDMKVVIGGKDDLFEQDELIENGVWEFKFKANKLDISKATQKINLDKLIKLQNGIEIYMKQMIITPFSVVVEIEADNLSEKDIEKNISISCIVEESNSDQLEIISEHTSINSDLKGSYELRLRNINKDIDLIKITPIVLFSGIYNENHEYNKELMEYQIDINIGK